MKLKFVFNNLYLRIFITWILLYFVVMFIWNLFYTQNKDFHSVITTWLNSHEKNSDIIVVEIDDQTLNQLSYPLPRKSYIPFIENLSDAWVSVVWFDIFFADKWNNKEIDDLLSSTIKKSWNIIFWSDIKEDIKLIEPYSKFNENLLDTWYFQPFLDKNNKVYSVEPFREFKWNLIEDSFAFSILKNFFINKWIDNTISYWVNNWVYDFFDKKIPVDYSTINWRNTYLFNIWFWQSSNFYRESFINIYNWNFDKDFFADKIVLVWYTAEWVKDDFILPSLWLTKWVFIHASIINNILSERFVVIINNNIERLFIFLFIISLLSFTILMSDGLSYRWQLFIWFWLLCIVTITYYSLFLIIANNTWYYYIPNYPIHILLLVIFSFLTSYILKYIIEDSNKIKLSKALWEYVSKDVAHEILHWEWTVNLSWERKKISIFFSDIAWFTTISEKLSPEELVWFLREYLWDMSKIIIDNKWFVNKYEWDAIMALWWVFTKEWNINSYDACYSAIKQQEALSKLNARWKSEWNDTFGVRMWIHTWEAIVWNIWAIWMKMEFTALWDAVNLGSRLEWVNKFYWTEICVSEDVYNEVKEDFEFRYLDKIRVKWKNIPINIYELICEKWQLEEEKLSVIKEFEHAMEYYLNKDFKKAKEIFNKLISLWDKPSEIFEKRCNSLSIKFETEIPRENWDWVWEMKEK